MSIEALNWVFKQDITPPSAKFVLVVMANVASNQDGFCYPSTQYICDMTSLDRKTVIAAIDTLEEKGYLIDTKERCGRTGQVKVYQLTMPLADSEGKGPENGTVPLLKAPVFPSKGS